MAYRITYTRLFRCQLRHDYYLNLGDTIVFNDLDPVADATDIATILSQHDLRTAVDIRPMGETARTLAGHRMKAVADRTGFFVGIATDPAPAGGRLPATPPSPGLAWNFGIYPRDGAEWTNVTNQRMRPNLPAIFYFSNQRPDWSAAVPAAPLSLAVPAIARQRRYYASGEVIEEAGVRYRAIQDVPDATVPVTDPASWAEETMVRGEATDADRVLLPVKFSYTLTPEIGITPTSLTVELNDLGGTPALPPQNFTLTPGQDRVSLDLSDASTPAWYDLVVTSDTDYATTHRILLDNTLYDPRAWGVVSIGHPAVDPGLRLLEADGRLRLNALGETEYPTYEIRIPNRSTYWRYVAHPTQTLTANADFSVDLRNRLVARSPRPLTRFGSQVTLPGGNGPNVLPSPEPRSLQPEPDGKVYSEVYLGVLNL
ncbi:hypothetical protein GGR28_002316 [Lewinella aquimaris]|uniref:Uncharacterized protein n=1 Tax=Neolewinella aquimaris TaxID=1835722 RepID=A0A840E3A7_9BACT|nr:hypothetical protein [Neolewinella aquimaris]MBB4079691.1 hypothetical protein [Neolewinella aquimaris]